MSREASAQWVVQCPDWTTKPLKTEEAARQSLEHVEQAGHCNYPHKVVRLEA